MLQFAEMQSEGVRGPGQRMCDYAPSSPSLHDADVTIQAANGDEVRGHV